MTKSAILRDKRPHPDDNLDAYNLPDGGPVRNRDGKMNLPVSGSETKTDGGKKEKCGCGPECASKKSGKCCGEMGKKVRKLD